MTRRICDGNEPPDLGSICSASYTALDEAALDPKPVSGWTHNFYRYPARFSPRFAAATVAEFSQPGDLVGDPYMGGGTSVIEAIAAGRTAVGNDLNSLATFVTRVKTTPLDDEEIEAVRAWATARAPHLSYRMASHQLEEFADSAHSRNMSLPRARFVRKVIAAGLASLADLPTASAKDFVRCVILRVGQWALDGRRVHTPLRDFRERLARTAVEMVEASRLLSAQVKFSGGKATLLNMDAAALDEAPIFREGKKRLKLVLTSPPYPGVHVLYHRWQVDGRRETPAPYWIAGCTDGKGASFYNFGDTRQGAADRYFQNSLMTLRTIRRIMEDQAHLVQLVAFADPDEQLPRYLDNLSESGFKEVRIRGRGRTWREVPHRKWHATFRGQSHGAKEVVLIHRAI